MPSECLSRTTITPYSSIKQNDEHMLSPFIALADFYPATSQHTWDGFYNPLSADGGRFRENDLPWTQASVLEYAPPGPFFLLLHSGFCPREIRGREGRRGYFSPPPALAPPCGPPRLCASPEVAAPAKPPMWPLCLQVWGPDPPSPCSHFGPSPP